MKRLVSLLLIAGGAFAQDAQERGQSAARRASARATAGARKYIVTFAPGAPGMGVVQGVGAQVRRSLEFINSVAITIPNDNALAALRNNPNVRRIVPDYDVASTPKPNNPGGGGGGTPITGGTRQAVSYEVQRVVPPTATSTGKGIGVAVLDTGIDLNHTDLKPNLSLSKFDAAGGSCQDQAGHGTHVAGLLAAANNNQDVVGVAPEATLYCVKVLDAAGNGDDSAVIAGLQWVAQNASLVTPPIRVVNVSLGRRFDPAIETQNAGPIFDAIQVLYNRGIVVIAAAGNDPEITATEYVPAGYTNVLAVAATVATGGVQRCDFLAFGPAVPVDAAAQFTTDGGFVNGRGITVSAPGEEREDQLQMGFNCTGFLYGTLSTTLGGGATRRIWPMNGDARGTSFAAPLVSGAVARVLQLNLVAGGGNAAFVEGVRTWIRNNADRKGAVPLDHPWGVPYTFDGEREGIVQAPR